MSAGSTISGRRHLGETPMDRIRILSVFALEGGQGLARGFFDLPKVDGDIVTCRKPCRVWLASFVIKKT
jgi:hypothetical protein